MSRAETRAADENDREGELDLDYSVLENRSGVTYSSVTDLYQADIFSEEFKLRTKAWEQQQMEEQKQLSEAMFMGSYQPSADLYELVTAKLFLGESKQILANEPDKGKEENLLIYGLGTVLIVMLFLLFLMQYMMKRKKVLQKDVNNSDIDLDEIKSRD